MSAAKALVSLYGATVVLKGPRTIVVSADGRRTYENDTGNPYLATGGAGDLLSGVIGARWAYLKEDAFTAVSSSVWLHGAAADAIVSEPRDPSIANVASEIGAMRIKLECKQVFPS
jgi:NAD(P)H-hydrate repair Nnr-like enzyme with NAD(P)H-hydrate dehydratase domain